MEPTMNEADLKRYLVKSIRAQGGVGQRLEDKYAIGWPDCVFIPERGPVFFVEVKIVKGAKLICTPIQEVQLKRLHRPRGKGGRFYAHGVIVGYHESKGALYIGRPGDSVTGSRFVPRPRAYDSTEWLITELLYKFDGTRMTDEIVSDVIDIGE